MTTHANQHQPGDNGDEFSAIVAGLSDLADLDTNQQQQPKPEPEPVQHARMNPVRFPPVNPAPEPPAPPQSQPPTAPTPPNYWGHRGLVVVYWIAIATGAVGQVIFFGDLFGIGLLGYLAAAIAATTSETIMVTAGDTAMQKRIHRSPRRQWVPFLTAAFAAAATASGLNIAHWYSESPSMAVLFGGIAALGFLLHVLDGFTEGTQYLAELDRYEAEVDRQQRRTDAHANAVYERELATYENTRQAAERATRTVEPDPKPQTPAKPTRQRPTGKASTSTDGRPKLDADTARAWSETHDRPGPSAVRRHFTAEGYQVPSLKTVQRWLNSN